MGSVGGTPVLTNEIELVSNPWREALDGHIAPCGSDRYPAARPAAQAPPETLAYVIVVNPYAAHPRVERRYLLAPGIRSSRILS